MNQVEQQKDDWLQKFVSLRWYDGVIEFLFRFVAKTSEPLLAAGLVISAADFLTKGALTHDSSWLIYAWAWTQAIAIEASSGVVFVYALQSFRQKDNVKAWVYLVLSVLLAVTGGAMLLFQLIANTTGLQEGSLPSALFYSLAGLRVLVSISYVYLCRAKHIRFTDLADEKEQIEQNISTDNAIKRLTEQMSILATNMGQITATVTEVKTTVTQITSASLPALPLRTEQNEPLDIVESSVPENEPPANKKEQIRQYLQVNPNASISEIMDHTNVTKSYASTVRSQLKEPS